MNLFHVAENYLRKTSDKVSLSNIVDTAIYIRKWMDRHPKQTMLICDGLEVTKSNHRAYYKKLGLM